ncbi:DUF309 domain-containing protein [Neobacillus sp. MM2021_6]|uniref:DUF309 domain-containing protein n=1 Tax=Bacillaceae TaxID=186817 RepID=UPI001407ED57|nr:MULTISPECIES: DUF309 domain-containing protein [Bacillaceae]MBO0958098.1 DUF309 domain-containing protein [Neobacillus sp. MM2021_6]NHC18434.1 DUF309 domain-containing protein [Bacillus sp. MM2020_4]
MYPKEYIQFLTHFHGDRDYFECHEVLEEYWKGIDSRNKSSVWVGLILMAVSTYHHRRSNFNGAKKTLEKAIRILDTQAGELVKIGLSPSLLHQLLIERLSLIEKATPYYSYNLPICDSNLLKICGSYCEHEGFQWGKDSDITNSGLIHRHKLRNRANVIAEREQSLRMRKGRK